MSATASLRQQLRIHTRGPHDTLDAALDLIERPLTLTQYGRLLGRFLGVHVAVEPLLARNLGPVLMQGRSKLYALEHDLQACGLPPDAIRRLPECRPLPVIASPGAALGALYVIEGSTLGGQVIARSIARNKQIPADACRYFNIYDARVGIRWREVCDTLEECHDQVAQGEAVETATRLFESLTLWLDPSHWRRDAADGGRDRD